MQAELHVLLPVPSKSHIVASSRQTIDRTGVPDIDT